MRFGQTLGGLPLARDGGACAARPGLIAEKGEPPRTPSIYATDTWSGRVGEAKYKRRDAKNNMRGCKVRNATATANANMNAMPFCRYIGSDWMECDNGNVMEQRRARMFVLINLRVDQACTVYILPTYPLNRTINHPPTTALT